MRMGASVTTPGGTGANPGARSSYFTSRQRSRRLRRAVTWALLFVGLIWFMFPLLWVISSSLKTYAEFNRIPPTVLPQNPQWGNYPEAWARVPFGRFFVNTAIITVVNIVGTLISCALPAYGFSRLRFRGRNFVFSLMLATMMLPWWVTLIPTYIIFRQLRWIDTWLPLTVPAFFGSASSTFLMRQFFLTLPRELDEAAELDGASKFGILWRILLPLTKPVLATIAIFTFMSNWDSYLQPLIYIHRPELFTISIGLAFLRLAVSATVGDPIQALVMAATVFTSLPLITIFFVGQKYFVRGIALTGRTGT
jgi:ABC-type glycerol-3-phosphate transport system permease component